MDKTKHNTDLYIVRGIPGAGKSTFAKKLIEKGLADVYYEADMFFEKNGKYEFDPSKLGLAHEWCRKQVETALDAGKTVVVSNTFTRLSEIFPYTDLCDDLGKTFKVVRLETNYGSIHNVPKDAIEKMKNRFQDYKDEVIVR